MRRRLIPFVFLVLMLGFAASASAGQKPTRKPKREAPYFVGNFDTCDFSQWHTQGPPASFTILRRPKVQGRCAAALTVGPWAFNGVPAKQQSDGAALWLSPARYGTVAQTVWQHFSVRFAEGYRATPGEWNWFAEWHNDNDFRKFIGPALTWEFPNLCWAARNIHGTTRIAMRIMGGSSTAPRTVWVNGPRLRTGHWYDFRVRTVWSPGRNAGFVQWWLDGKRLYSRNAGTLYTRPDGSVSTVYFVLVNYRRHASWDATIQFDGARLGPTRSSVRY
jgi:Polysaccharide lyase